MKSALSFFLLFFAVSTPVHAQPGSLQGSPVLQGLGQAWADAYARKSPEFKLQVLGDGNDAGFVALKARKVDVVNSSRHITYRELGACRETLGESPREYKTGVQGVAVYVHAANPVKELTLAELRGIFTGKITNWRRLGGEDRDIAVYAPAANPAANEFFKDSVLEGKELLAEAKLANEASFLASIATNKDAIGYGSLTNGQGVTFVGVKRAVSSTPVEPSEETIRDQTYPISGYLYAYLDPKSDQGSLKSFLEWIRSPEGQRCLKPAGFFPLPEKLILK